MLTFIKRCLTHNDEDNCHWVYGMIVRDVSDSFEFLMLLNSQGRVSNYLSQFLLMWLCFLLMLQVALFKYLGHLHESKTVTMEIFSLVAVFFNP